MNWADYAILAVVGVSALISIVRGFVREALSLAGWILAFWLAVTFSGDAARLLAPYVETPSVRHALGFGGVFLATLLVTGLAVWLVGLVVDKTGMSGTDRMVGVVFGVGRGVVIVAVLVLLAGLTPLPRDPWWRESTLLPHFQSLAVEVRGLLPAEIAARLRY